MTSLPSQVALRLDALFKGSPPSDLAVAVSGGGDSLALLHLANDWAQLRSTCLHAVTVDHGLRAESADEAVFVAQHCARLKIRHKILTWTGWDGRGNLQDMARQARRKLIEHWCGDLGIGAVLTGHTADDQAETVLMRLARGSGVDGLAGMAWIERHSVLWLRPLLAQRREDLRIFMKELGLEWIEDPSNEDLRFDRIRARQMLDQLGDLGLSLDRLTQTAEHMQAAQRSLWDTAVAFARTHVVEDRGDLILSNDVLALERGDTERRVFAAAIGWISGAQNRPRFNALQLAAQSLKQGKRTTLQGVLLTPEAENIRLSREPSTVVNLRSDMETGREEIVWDRRWRIKQMDQGKGLSHISVQSLGEVGLVECPNWRESGLPRETLVASPAVWADNRLISAPLAGSANGWCAFIHTKFVDSLLSH